MKLGERDTSIDMRSACFGAWVFSQSIIIWQWTWSILIEPNIVLLYSTINRAYKSFVVIKTKTRPLDLFTLRNKLFLDNLSLLSIIFFRGLYVW